MVATLHQTMGRRMKQMKEFWSDANSRKRALRIFISGTGFLAGAYDIFIIGVVLLIMKDIDYGVPLTRDIQAQVAIAALVGDSFGMLFFGFMGDRFGRRSMFMYSAFLTIVGNFMQVLVQPHPSFSIWQQLMVARFVMGVGVGGEYPMAATVTAEVSEPAQRGKNIAGVFSMQGVGRVACALILVLAVHVIPDPDFQWRFSIGMGALPMCMAAFFRWLPETEVYHKNVKLRVPPSERLQVILQTVWDNRLKLLGTAGSWFILDVLFYGNSLFSADVTRAMDLENTIKDKALQNLYVQLLAMPGYLCGIALIDRMGRKNMQMFGFTGQMMMFAVMAAYQPPLRAFPALFLIIYALTFFFDDCGPNTTAFVIPAEIYPTEARSTCHGISAAFGKAGAALGGWLFLRVSNAFCEDHLCHERSPQDLVDKGLRLVFWCCAALSLLGLVWTWGFVNDEVHISLVQKVQFHGRYFDDYHQELNYDDDDDDGASSVASSHGVVMVATVNKERGAGEEEEKLQHGQP